MSPSVFFLVLFAVTSLFAVNMYLRGRWTRYIELGLFAILYGWALSAFYFLNWKWGLLVLVAPFGFLALLVPVGRSVARLMIRGPLRDPLGRW